VIHEVDALLRELIEGEVEDGENIEIAFDAPDKDWAARRTQPTVDVYLYDVRRDVTRNEYGTVVVRDDNGRITGKRPTPNWFRLAYLVTAWTQRPEDEHRLLSSLLQCFTRNDFLPVAEEGTLADVGAPLPLGVALPPPQDRSLSDVWSALGGDLKPSIDVVVIAPLMPDRIDGVGPPVTVEPIITLTDVDIDERRETAGGRRVPDGWENARIRRPPLRLEDGSLA
jgi:Pvc16 N-terminal domain